MVDYPDSLSTDALMTLVDVARGKVDKSLGIQAAWNLLGFGLGQGFPIQQGFGDAEPNSPSEIVEACHELIADLEHPEVKKGLGGLALGIVLKFAVKIVLEALS